MIFDSLKHVDNYKGLGKVYDALRFLADTDLDALPLGRVELNDTDFYIVQEYETEPKEIAEAHEQFIDIQLIVHGSEVMSVASIDCEKELVSAEPEKDMWKFRCATQPVTVTDGEFMVFFPSDIHMPAATLADPVHIRKVLVKLKA